MGRIAIAIIMLIALVSSANANDRSLVDQWYNALKASDRSAFEKILSEGAEIILKQLDVSQTKTEFIEALDNWENVAAGLELTYEAQNIDATGASAEVCYRFPASAFTNLEIFTFEGNRITQQEQQRLQDGCK